jgi:16S rRNA (uracil1498-N3)-methyltransferase
VSRTDREGGGRGPRVAAATLATFVTDQPLAVDAVVVLDEDAAHHMRVRRLEPGEPIALRDGAGRSGDGRLVRLAKSQATVELVSVVAHPPPPPVHLLVPVADRDRMLWLAEKAVELGIATWRPVHYRRSRSVASRGEGAGFEQKVRARMRAALAQSEAAWLPTLHADAGLDEALAQVPPGARLVGDPDGGRALDVPVRAGEPVTVAVGPEGGFEPEELDALRAGGFRAVALPGNILRFETAAVVAAAFARALHERAGAAAD